MMPTRCAAMRCSSWRFSDLCKVAGDLKPHTLVRHKLPRTFSEELPGLPATRIKYHNLAEIESQVSASPPRTVSINRPCDVVVSAHASPKRLETGFPIGDRGERVQEVACRSSRA